MLTGFRPDVDRFSPPATGVASATVPVCEWFDVLDALEGRSIGWGTIGGRPVAAGVIEVADWAPFDRIIELIVREDVTLRRRRELIERPHRIDTSVLPAGGVQLRIHGVSAPATLVMWPGAAGGQPPVAQSRRAESLRLRGGAS